MAKKVHSDDDKQRALAMLAAGVGVSETADRLGIPKQTISRWKTEGQTDEVFVAQQRKNKARLVDASWEAIHDATEITVRRLKAARKDERAFLELLDEIENDEEISETRRTELYRKFKKLSVSDLSDLSKVISVLYDKQALAANESTENIGGSGKLEVSLKVVK
ncbi:helix-turn-helix domain-containing protein [Butyricicoccus sp. Marseille-Q5471]|uniref:helix-turn-helix domain-containing protein n=1 Tax=Butyricicoccus sp. Marseille-Q5471 TaxID=3039493 RepID=UPI0024BC82C3|nr:helix-turn-helix domain-containing protein [Butyricicoccus sp. Marseille-Q5471]